MRTVALRVFCIAAAACAVSACGFHPLYGRLGADPGAQAIFSSIFVDPIEQERLGYELRNDLIDLLRATDRSEGAIYHLKISVVEKREGVALQNDATITRYDLAINAKYELTDAKAKVIDKGVESTRESFDVANSPYASLNGQESAERNAAQDVAEHIRLDLGLHFVHPR